MKLDDGRGAIVGLSIQPLVEDAAPDTLPPPVVVRAGETATLGRSGTFADAVTRQSAAYNKKHSTVSRAHVTIRATDDGALVELVGQNTSYFRHPSVAAAAGQPRKSKSGPAWSPLLPRIGMLVVKRDAPIADLALVMDLASNTMRHKFRIRLLHPDDLAALERNPTTSSTGSAAYVPPISNDAPRHGSLEEDGDDWTDRAPPPPHVPARTPGKPSGALTDGIANIARANPFAATSQPDAAWKSGAEDRRVSLTNRRESKPVPPPTPAAPAPTPPTLTPLTPLKKKAKKSTPGSDRHRWSLPRGNSNDIKVKPEPGVRIMDRVAEYAYGDDSESEGDGDADEPDPGYSTDEENDEGATNGKVTRNGWRARGGGGKESDDSDGVSSESDFFSEPDEDGGIAYTTPLPLHLRPRPKRLDMPPPPVMLLSDEEDDEDEDAASKRPRNI
ncbi:hypothetical protein H9P43_001625 [Blastocladiella emersonii ATCC 22665]|nr:hypothetical protein H9P43_001625 [Blastocladiella emersonii ATCC 22665]